MAKFHKMVSLERTPEDKVREHATEMPAILSIPDVPYGLRICLTEAELEKLDLEDECEVGDMVHLFCMAKVTSVSKEDSGGGPRCRIELSITDMAVEDEDTENEEGDED
jgi:hypothetical protein